MKIAKPLRDVIESFEKLPGIGPKTAQRLGFYLLHIPQTELEKFAESLINLKKHTVLCSICKNVSETDPCPICSDIKRDKTQILVVEEPFDILAFEKTGKYSGLYHVLHGSINPLDNIGPEELFINDLIVRIKGEESERVKEIIIATNPTMEGEATAMYIAKEVKRQKSNDKSVNGDAKINHQLLTITRLGVGIPTGAYLEFADELTLTQAIEGRRNYD